MVIYKTTNLINGKIYIGQDTKNNPNYLGSGVHILRAIKKHGKKNFKKEIIDICYSLEELNEREKYWIQLLNSRDLNVGYNLTFGGQVKPWSGMKHKPETIAKIRNKALNRKHSETTIKKLSGKNNHFYGKTHSDETKKKISESNKGRKVWNTGCQLSEETKKKISESNKGKQTWLGRTHSEETKNKLKQYNTGRQLSEETKKKISESNKGRISYWKGKKRTIKDRNNISISLRKIIYQIIDNEIVEQWNGIHAAALFLGVSDKTVGNYCRLKNKENKLGLIYKEDYEKTFTSYK
jgi:group I intron endonuclease